MITQLNDLTVEHIGSEADEDDLDELRRFCKAYMDEYGASEADAIAMIWGEGDYYSRARYLLSAESFKAITESY